MSDNNSAAPQSAVPAANTQAPQDASQAPQIGQVPGQTVPQTVAQAKKMLKKLSYKVDGADVEDELPFEIPEEHAEYMRKQLSLTKGAQKRMAEKAQLENEVKAFFNELKKDPKSGLNKLGIDPRQFAASMLEEELRQQSLTPEQKELEELKAKLQAAEADRKSKDEEFTKKELERATQVEYERISNRIEKAIDTSGLPKEPAIVKRIANYMLVGNQLGVKLDPEDLVEVVREDMFNEIQGLIKSLGAEKVEQLIGKDMLTQIRKKNVAKAKTTPATAKSGMKETAKSIKGEPKTTTAPKKSMKDFFGF